MNSNITPLLERNCAFAETDTRTNAPRLPFLPHLGLFIVTCMDSRTDPADFLGLRFGQAIVARTVGGAGDASGHPGPGLDRIRGRDPGAGGSLLRSGDHPSHQLR
jgi:hypothetical protein